MIDITQNGTYGMFLDNKSLNHIKVKGKTVNEDNYFKFSQYTRNLDRNVNTVTILIKPLMDGKLI